MALSWSRSPPGPSPSQRPTRTRARLRAEARVQVENRRWPGSSRGPSLESHRKPPRASARRESTPPTRGGDASPIPPFTVRENRGPWLVRFVSDSDSMSLLRLIESVKYSRPRSTIKPETKLSRYVPARKATQTAKTRQTKPEIPSKADQVRRRDTPIKKAAARP